jgi:hypothetical protein
MDDLKGNQENRDDYPSQPKQRSVLALPKRLLEPFKATLSKMDKSGKTGSHEAPHI